MRVNTNPRLKDTTTNTATADTLLELHEDSSAKSVVSFPFMTTDKKLPLPLANQGVMNTDEQQGGQNVTTQINLSLREMYMFHDTADDDVDHAWSPNNGINDRYPPSDTPPQSLITGTGTNTALISQKAIESLLHSPSTAYSSRNEGSEPSSEANPPINVASTASEDIAKEERSDLTFVTTSRAGSGGAAQQQRSHNRQPSIYSAIGSLEDPFNSSFKSHADSSDANDRQRKSNYEFPSMTTTLLAPQRPGAAAKKHRIISEASSAKQTREVLEIPWQSPPGDGALRQQNDRRVTKSDDATARMEKDESNDGPLGTGSRNAKTKGGKKVTMDPKTDATTSKLRKPSKKQNSHNKNPIEMFRPSSDAYTPRMGKKEIKYKPAAMRTPVQQMASPLGTLSRPNFRDALRRVAMIIHQHIVKIERRFEQHRTPNQTQGGSTISLESTSSGGRGYGRHHPRYRNYDGLFSTVMKETFSEDRYITPRYKCTMVRVPMALAGMVYGLKQIRELYEIPTESEIYEFAHQLFKTVQLSSECSIVGLIYVERLMETAKVPLLAETWRPIFMCGLLMASKVWQDLSSWNIEFASVYPRYSLESINRLELQFLRMIKWDLYISSSQYAKYYFALRSLVEKPDFRQRYNRMVGGVDSVQESQARKIEVRSTMLKEEAILHLSRSM